MLLKILYSWKGVAIRTKVMLTEAVICYTFYTLDGRLKGNQLTRTDMTLFLFTFFIIYSGVHLYAFLKAKAAIAFGAYPSVFLGLLMASMIFAPIIVRLSEKSGYELFARALSYIGYSWMGILFLFFSVSVAIDLYRLIVRLAGLSFKTDFSGIIPSNQTAFFIPLILAVCIGIYGYFEAKNIKTEKLTIKTSKMPEGVERLRIVQISDVHIGLLVREDRLNRILAEVKKAEPDIFVSTGDLVDGQINSLKGLAELFNFINPRYGKFAITGNHEFYAGIKEAVDFTEKAGFTMLRGKGLSLDGLINIVGIDDPAGKGFNFSKVISEKELLSGFSREKFTLLLKHRPLFDKNSPGLFDLQLSGHIHKGQIFPFSMATWLYYPVNSGGVNLPDNSYMYVSRGSGTWGPPIRFLSPPEVTVIDIIRSNE